MFDKFRISLDKLDTALARLQNFMMFIDFKVTSSYLPDFFMSKYKDSLRLYKKDSRMRLDYSLSPGKEPGEFTRCAQSLIFNCTNINSNQLNHQNRIVLVNRDKQTYSMPFSKITIGEKKSLFRDVFFKIEQKNVDFIVDRVKLQDLKAKHQKIKTCEKYMAS